MSCSALPIGPRRSVNISATGPRFGLDIEYVVEDQPLGTGGGIRNVFERLRARDGDGLQRRHPVRRRPAARCCDTHRGNNADVTLHLVRVDDPRAFGCVPTDADGRVQAFLEKTDDPPTDQINAGCYVFRRDVIEGIPAGQVRSRWNETPSPRCCRWRPGVRPRRHVSYWLDLGTPIGVRARLGRPCRWSGADRRSAQGPGARHRPVDPDGAQVDRAAVINGGSAIEPGPGSLRAPRSAAAW